MGFNAGFKGLSQLRLNYYSRGTNLDKLTVLCGVADHVMYLVTFTIRFTQLSLMENAQDGNPVPNGGVTG